MKNVWLSLLCTALLLTGCEQNQAKQTFSLSAFGTIIDVTVYADAQLAAKAVQQLEQQLLDQHHNWHAWQQDGTLFNINQSFAEGNSATEISPDLLELIRQGQHFERLSQGRFNPAIGKLIGIWGFHGDKGNRPSDEQINQIAASKPSMTAIHIDGAQVYSHNPHVQLDLGGYAKGYAVELGLQLLRQFDIHNAMINAGGDLKVIGEAGNRPWQVGIRDPSSTHEIIATLDLTPGEAVFTSGSYIRAISDDNGSRHHIIDPQAARPSRHWRSVTVVHHDATLADAAATALMISTPGDWRELAGRMGISQALLIANDGETIVTPELKHRLHWKK